jgi:hypothetical protein
MSSRVSSLGLCLLALALLTACGGAPSPAAPTQPPGSYPAPGAAPTQAAPPGGYPIAPGVEVPAGAQALLSGAVADLVQRTGAVSTDITVVEVTPQSWPDASLGCPVEGQLYAQVVTEGYRIVLEAGGQRYAYHTDLSQAVYCEQDQP